MVTVSTMEEIQEVKGVGRNFAREDLPHVEIGGEDI
jgi:hypothetical protein